MYKYFFPLSQNDSRSFFILIPVIFFVFIKTLKKWKGKLKKKPYIFKGHWSSKRELFFPQVFPIALKDIFISSLNC